MEQFLLGNLDVVSFLGSWLQMKRGVTVDQEFQIALAKVGNKIQMEQLQREDIRDLVSLTTDRTDIYNVVTTLLLAFCVEWFTSSALFEQKQIDEWFTGLFYLSNFNSVAYLILSLWLAMRASVIAHASGVKLLTTRLRLSIPNAAQLNGLKIPATQMPEILQGLYEKMEHSGLYEKMEHSVKVVVQKLEGGPWQFLARQLGMQTNELSGISDAPSEAPPAAADAPGTSSISRDESGTSSIFADIVNALSEGGSDQVQLAQLEDSRSDSGDFEDHDDEEEDVDTNHFRTFYQEQQKWLNYDAYSRLCMSLGMNQLLQSLSYYILGYLLNFALASAIASFCALQILSALLVRMDVVREDFTFIYSLQDHRIKPLSNELEARRMDADIELTDWQQRCRAFAKDRSELLLIHDATGRTVADENFPVTVRTVADENFPVTVRIASAGLDFAIVWYVCGYVIPPVMVTVTLIAEMFGDFPKTDTFVKCICYLLHACWIHFVCASVSEAGVFAKEIRKKGPVLRFAQYMNVLGPQQLKTSRELRAEQRYNMLRTLYDTRRGLVNKLWDLKQNGEIREAERGQIKKLAKRLKRVIEDLNAMFPGDAYVKDQTSRAQQVHDCYAIWEMYQLGPSGVAARDQKTAQPSFEPTDEDYPQPPTSPSQLAPLQPTGSVESLRAAGPIGPSMKQSTASRPPGIAAPSFRAEDDDSFPVADLQATGSSHRLSFSMHEDPPPLPGVQSSIGTQPLLQRSASSGGSPQLLRQFLELFEGRQLREVPDKWFERQFNAKPPTYRFQGSPSMNDENASPDALLPAKLFKHLSRCITIFWILAAGINLLGIAFNWHFYSNPTSDNSTKTVLVTNWPAGAAFMQVNSLSCNGSHVVVGTEFAMLAGEEKRLGEFNFTGLDTGYSNGDSASFTTMFKNSDAGCEVLSKVASSWTLRTLGSNQLGAAVPIPPSWHVVAAAPLPCNMQNCGEAYLAGWDGIGIVVAWLKLDTKTGSWSFQPRFRVQPGFGECLADKSTCATAEKVGKYENVTAILLERAGQQLTVLSANGAIDFWDLPEGILRHRQHLGTTYTAMCHHGQRMLLARNGRKGPVIEELRLGAEEHDDFQFDTGTQIQTRMTNAGMVFLV